MTDKFEVSTYYACDGVSFGLDDTTMDAVGRDADETGWGCGQRDLGWLCASKREATKIKSILENIGMPVSVMELQP